MTIGAILHGRTGPVISARKEDSVRAVIDLLAQNRIGAVPVLENDMIIGIFSERDYARKGIIQGRKAKSTTVSTVMTADVITVSPEQSIEHCMQLMSHKKFRHLPVIDRDMVVGVVSISDLVSAIIREQEFRIQSLEQYITGG